MHFSPHCMSAHDCLQTIQNAANRLLIRSTGGLCTGSMMHVWSSPRFVFSLTDYCTVRPVHAYLKSVNNTIQLTLSGQICSIYCLPHTHTLRPMVIEPLRCEQLIFVWLCLLPYGLLTLCFILRSCSGMPFIYQVYLFLVTVSSVFICMATSVFMVFCIL